MKTIKNYFVSFFLVTAMPLTSALAQDAFPSTGSAGIETAAPDVDLIAASDNTANAVAAATYWKEVFMEDEISDNDATQLNITLTIPAAWQSQIVRVDYENESIFSLKAGDKVPAFLFSVTKVTGDQWMRLKDQIKGYTIIENKDDFITFVQKTDVKNIKGQADVQYQQVLGELDAIVGSIRVK